MTIQVVDELKAIMAGFMGGAKYGVKIRVPHALLMTFLFRRDLSSRDKLKSVCQLALEHATNLASFAALYKTLVMMLKFISRSIQRGWVSSTEGQHLGQYMGRLLLTLLVDGPPTTPYAFRKNTKNGAGHRLVERPPGHAENSYHAFVAGAIGGYVIWGRYSAVNYQIVLYLTSRVLVATLKRFYQKYSTVLPPMTFRQSYPYFAALVWGAVMMIFEEHPDVLHVSLRRSMDAIYRSRPGTTHHNHHHHTRTTTTTTAPTPAGISRLLSSSSSSSSSSPPLSSNVTKNVEHPPSK